MSSQIAGWHCILKTKRKAERRRAAGCLVSGICGREAARTSHALSLCGGPWLSYVGSATGVCRLTGRFEASHLATKTLGDTEANLDSQVAVSISDFAGWWKGSV